MWGVPVCNRHQGEGGANRGGTVISHLFQRGVGDGDESSFPRRGGGTVMSYPFLVGVGDRDESSFLKGHVPREGGTTYHSQGEGVGGCAPSKHSIFLDGFDIKKLAAIKVQPYYYLVNYINYIDFTLTTRACLLYGM